MRKGTSQIKAKPTEKEVFEVISLAKPLWDSLISFIENNYKIKGEFTFKAKFSLGIKIS